MSSLKSRQLISLIVNIVWIAKLLSGTLSHLERVFTLLMPHAQNNAVLVIANKCVGKDSSISREEKIQACYNKSNLRT